MILVTGATGTIGRPLVDGLVDQGAKVRAVTHNPQAANLPAGVEVANGDLSRPEEIAPLLEGVTGLFLHPRAVGLAAGELLAQARQQAVQPVVVLSAMNVDDDLETQPSRYQGDRNKEVEDAAVQSGLEWVSLRASSFASNALRAWAPDPRRWPRLWAVRGLQRVADPRTGPGRGRHARAAQRRARGPTGPEAGADRPAVPHHQQMVAIIGEAIGRPLRYQEIPPEAAKQGMVQQGIPEPFVEVLIARYAREIGEPAPVTGQVQRILGRPGRTYAEWAADHADAFWASDT